MSRPSIWGIAPTPFPKAPFEHAAVRKPITNFYHHALACAHFGGEFFARSRRLQPTEIEGLHEIDEQRSCGINDRDRTRDRDADGPATDLSKPSNPYDRRLRAGRHRRHSRPHYRQPARQRAWPNNLRGKPPRGWWHHRGA